jgi:hypothetical protein
MKKFIFPLSTLLTFMLSNVVAFGCPFCSENLSKNSGGFSGGLSMGIMITIFMLLGFVGSLAGFVVWLMIKEGKKSDRRHELARQAVAASEVPTTV